MQVLPKIFYCFVHYLFIFTVIFCNCILFWALCQNCEFSGNRECNKYFEKYKQIKFKKKDKTVSGSSQGLKKLLILLAFLSKYAQKNQSLQNQKP